MEKRKYYVVWEGLAPGIYDSWEECSAQITGVRGARYKGFSSRQEAIVAFRQGSDEATLLLQQVGKAFSADSPKKTVGYIAESIAVDAACSGNPGPMEYQGVYVKTGKQLFSIGPLPEGTNNVGEFLALVHGLALLKQHNSPLPLYTDSQNAITWVRKKSCRTQLARTAANAPIFDLIARAEKWLRENTYTTPILKWETKAWGEIPADFGRK